MLHLPSICSFMLYEQGIGATSSRRYDQDFFTCPTSCGESNDFALHGDYHKDKIRRWATNLDDSHVISHNGIPNADECTYVEVGHKVGPDWTFNNITLTPMKCNHYHLRMRVQNSNANFILDDVSIVKMDDTSSDALPLGNTPGQGFLFNSNIALSHQFWKSGRSSGFITQDDGMPDQNTMVLSRGEYMRQNVLRYATPNKKY